MDQNAFSIIIKTLRDNPSLQHGSKLLMEGARESIESGTLVTRVHAILETHGELPVLSLASLIDRLVILGGLARTILLDGVVYEGDPDKLFELDSVTEDTHIQDMVCTTATGLAVCEALDPSMRTEMLLDSNPEYLDGFLMTLNLCTSDTGISTQRIESALDESGYLFRSACNGTPGACASMYTTLLKDAGALEWKHAWFVTKAGRHVLAHHS